MSTWKPRGPVGLAAVVMIGILAVSVVPCSFAAQAAPPPGTKAAQAKPEAARQTYAPTVFERVIMFFPDRFMDMLDVFSGGVGVGYGIRFARHITYYLHVPSISLYRSFNLRWDYNRDLCWCINNESEFGLLFLWIYDSEFTGKGTGWNNGKPGEGTKKYAEQYTTDIDDPIHKEGFRDPWAVGLGYGPLILSPTIEIDVHPVELVDFAVGLVTLGIVDVRGDDFVSR